MKNGYVTMWECHVRLDSLAEFEKRYGADGDWAMLFHRSSGFIETLLLKDLHETGKYITLDRWQSAEAFKSFRSKWEQDYIGLDNECNALTLSEKHLGTFSE